MTKIKIGIVGYGNLGRGIETALTNSSDMELFAIFTRRDPATLCSGSKVESYDSLINFKNEIDVLILAGGSQKIFRCKDRSWQLILTPSTVLIHIRPSPIIILK